MKKRLTMAVAAGALMMAMVPGVTSAAQPIVENVVISCLTGGEPKEYSNEIRGPLGEVRREIATEWYAVCDPGTVEITAFVIQQ